MANTTHSRGLLVAETDENDRGVPVWIKDDHDRHPHPLRAAREFAQVALDRYHVSGARREDIAGWLTTRH